MTLPQVFMAWTSLLSLNALDTVLVVAADASLALASNIELQKRMPWNGFKWNMKELSLTSPKTLVLKAIFETCWVFFFPISFGQLPDFCLLESIFSFKSFELVDFFKHNLPWLPCSFITIMVKAIIFLLKISFKFFYPVRWLSGSILPPVAKILNNKTLCTNKFSCAVI